MTNNTGQVLQNVGLGLAGFLGQRGQLQRQQEQQEFERQLARTQEQRLEQIADLQERRFQTNKRISELNAIFKIKQNAGDRALAFMEDLPGLELESTAEGGGIITSAPQGFESLQGSRVQTDPSGNIQQIETPSGFTLEGGGEESTIRDPEGEEVGPVPQLLRPGQQQDQQADLLVEPEGGDQIQDNRSTEEAVTDLLNPLQDVTDQLGIPGTQRVMRVGDTLINTADTPTQAARRQLLNTPADATASEFPSQLALTEAGRAPRFESEIISQDLQNTRGLIELTGEEPTEQVMGVLNASTNPEDYDSFSDFVDTQRQQANLQYLGQVAPLVPSGQSGEFVQQNEQQFRKMFGENWQQAGEAFLNTARQRDPQRLARERFEFSKSQVAGAVASSGGASVGRPDIGTTDLKRINDLNEDMQGFIQGLNEPLKPVARSIFNESIKHWKAGTGNPLTVPEMNSGMRTVRQQIRRNTSDTSPSDAISMRWIVQNLGVSFPEARRLHRWAHEGGEIQTGGNNRDDSEVPTVEESTEDFRLEDEPRASTSNLIEDFDTA